jgi:hypothetical protein
VTLFLLDKVNFINWCRECKFVDKKVQTASLDILFKRCNWGTSGAWRAQQPVT